MLIEMSIPLQQFCLTNLLLLFGNNGLNDLLIHCNILMFTLQI